MFMLAACTQAAAPVPTAEPGVIYTFPSDGQIDVPVGARIVVAFSDPVVASAVTACTGTATSVTGAFCLVGPDGPVAATGEVVADGRAVQFSSAALAPGTTYEVYARSALAPTAKNLPAGALFAFTTRTTQPRAAAPRVVAFNGVALDASATKPAMFESTTIRLVFSEPLDPRTAVLGPGAIELIDMTTGTAVPASLFAQGIHVSIDPQLDLVAGRAYELKIGDGVADLSGQPVAAMTIAVTPERTGDHPIQQVLRTRQSGDRGPTIAHTGAPANAIAIDEPLIGLQTVKLMPSTLAAELGDPSIGGPLAFTIRRGQRMRTGGLDVKLGGELPVGLSTGDIAIELLTDAGGRITRNPHQPDQRPDNDRTPLVVELSLDLAVYAADAAGNAVLTQTVLGVQGSGVVVATDGVLDIEAVIAIDLDLLGVTQAPANLVLELITDLLAASDTDAEAPMLLASMPGDVGDPLDVDAGVELIFTEPIDLARARAGGIRLETADGAEVPSVLESHGAAVVVRPRAPLDYATSYRVALTDVADTAGNLLAPAEPMSFTTPALLATTVPLAVVAVHPGAPCALTGATDSSPGRCANSATSDDVYRPFELATDERIEVQLTQPQDPASIVLGDACGAGSVRIEEIDAVGACVGAVAGSVIQHERGLSFVPDAPWRVGAHYRLTLVSGNNASCADGEVCGITGVAASFDPLAGVKPASAGGPDFVIDFVGVAASDATLVLTHAAPFTDINGSGFTDTGEPDNAANRVALHITGTTGIVTHAEFAAPDCLPDMAGSQGCVQLSGAMPVQLLPLAHDCALPGGETAARCVPVLLSPQAMYATSLTIKATAVLGSATIALDAILGMLIMRIREPATGPLTGYLIEDPNGGMPTMVVALDIYLDAPDLSFGSLLNHDLHSKPISLTLRGPLRFLPDGRISITVASTAEIPLSVHLTQPGTGAEQASVDMIMPMGELKLQLVSPALRGGLR